MHKFWICLSALGLFIAAGCQEKPKTEANAPGVQVKSGEGGTEVKTLAADIDVKK